MSSEWVSDPHQYYALSLKAFASQEWLVRWRQPLTLVFPVRTGQAPGAELACEWEILCLVGATGNSKLHSSPYIWPLIYMLANFSQPYKRSYLFHLRFAKNEPIVHIGVSYSTLTSNFQEQP